MTQNVFKNFFFKKQNNNDTESNTIDKIMTNKI